MDYKAPPHRSFSQLGTYRKCQHLYYLTKMVGLKEDPSVWLAGGSAIHEMIEKVNHEFVRQERIETRHDGDTNA